MDTNYAVHCNLRALILFMHYVALGCGLEWVKDCSLRCEGNYIKQRDNVGKDCKSRVESRICHGIYVFGWIGHMKG